MQQQQQQHESKALTGAESKGRVASLFKYMSFSEGEEEGEGKEEEAADWIRAMVVNDTVQNQLKTLAKATGTLVQEWERDERTHPEFVAAMSARTGSVPAVFAVITSADGGLYFRDGKNLAELIGTAMRTDLTRPKSADKTVVFRVRGCYMYVFGSASEAPAIAMRQLCSIRPGARTQIESAFKNVTAATEDADIVPTEFDSLNSGPGLIFILDSQRAFVTAGAFVDALVHEDA